MNSFLTEYDEEKVLAEIGQEKYEDGLEAGIEQGIKALILDNLEEGHSREIVLEKLQKRFNITPEKAIGFYEKFTK